MEMTARAPQVVSTEGQPNVLAAEKALLELVNSIYDSAADDVPCGRAVSLLRKILGAAWVVLMLRPATLARPALVATAGGTPSLPDDSPYVSVNDIPPGGVFRALDAETVHLLGGAGLRRAQNIIGADVMISPTFRARLRIGRMRRAGAVSTHETAVVEAVLPHLRRALRIQDDSTTGSIEANVLRAAADSMCLGLVILDESGKILQINPCAERTLKARKHVGIMKGTIHCLNSSEDRALWGAIRTVQSRSREPGAPAGVAVCAGRDECDTWVSMLVRALPPGRFACGSGTAATVIYIRRSDQQRDISAESVRQVFGLTKTESMLAMHMAEGASLDEAAAVLEIRRNTARTHLRAIFSKVGVRRQTELVRILLSSVALMV